MHIHHIPAAIKYTSIGSFVCVCVCMFGEWGRGGGGESTMKAQRSAICVQGVEQIGRKLQDSIKRRSFFTVPKKKKKIRIVCEMKEQARTPKEKVFVRSLTKGKKMNCEPERKKDQFKVR